MEDPDAQVVSAPGPTDLVCISEFHDVPPLSTCGMYESMIATGGF